MKTTLEYEHERDYDNKLEIDIRISRALSSEEYRKLRIAVFKIRQIIDPILRAYKPKKEKN